MKNDMDMLTKEEKAVFIVGYFTGTIDRDVQDGMHEATATEAGHKAMYGIFAEFGLKLPDPAKVVRFIKELNVISSQLTKEWKLDQG